MGVNWTLKDTCDYVKKREEEEMEDRFRRTAARQNHCSSEKELVFPGPGSPSIHPSMQSNGFNEYINSGGLSSKEDLGNQINSIAQRLAEIKKKKGVLMLNNGKPNGGSWK